MAPPGEPRRGEGTAWILTEESRRVTQQQVGKYQLIRKLATGGMAEVFLAKAAGPMGFEKTLVLKRILPHLAEEPAFVQMFLAEAKLAARLTHPHIAQIFDFGESEGSYFLAMEYVDGPSLRTLIKRAAGQKLPLPSAVCARLVSHACEGLAFAHDFADETGEPMGLIHRDISPDNILLSRQGSVKVVDFGIAKAAGQSHKTQSGVIKGKLAYMPPEQLRAREMDRRVDVYALGVVLYELLTGQRPYTSDSDAGLMQAILFESAMPAARVRPDLPEFLRRILERALAKERDQRYPDCHALQSDLEDFILSVGKPVTTQQVAQLIQVTSSTDLPSVAPAAPPPPTPPPPAPSTPPFLAKKRPSASGVVATVQTVSLRADNSGVADATRTELTPPSALADPAPAPATKALQPTRPEAPPAPPARRPDMKNGAESQAVMSAARKPASSSGWRLAVGAAVILAGGGVALWALGSKPEARPLPAPAERAPELAAAPPAQPPAEPVAVPSSALSEETGTPTSQAAGENAAGEDAGSALAAVPPAEPDVAPDSGVALAPAPTAPVAEPLKPKRTVVRTGFLQLRIQPYAVVYVDDKNVGETPLPPLKLSAGRHTVKLVNTKLSMTETHSVSIQAEQTHTLKRNLLEK